MWPSIFPSEFTAEVLQAHLHFVNVVCIDLVYLFLRTFLAVGLVLLGYKVVGLAVATLVALAPSLFLYPYLVSRDLPFVRLSASQWSPKLAKDLFSYDLYTFLGFLASPSDPRATPSLSPHFSASLWLPISDLPEWRVTTTENWWLR